MKTELSVVFDSLFFEHRPPSPHPERPARLEAAKQALDASRVAHAVLAARDATDVELARVHTEEYIVQLGQMAGKRGRLDADTYCSPQSVAAARRAAGGAVQLVDALLDGGSRYGLGLLRPPGHHARPGAAMGFCLLNNAAIAAAHALERGARRVLVLDWDVHHGNGTQEMFYERPEVLYLSLHQSPFYPGTGAASEIGAGDGAGFTVNVPLTAGAGNDAYLTAFEHIVRPIVTQFDPDLVLVSAGFDAHARDPLGQMQVDGAGYASMLGCVMGALPRGAAGRLALLLEGGYDLQALSESLTACLGVLAADGRADARADRWPSPDHDAQLETTARRLANYWKLG
ncbi:MAG TPA: histone deacetylase [Polyangiaceae bacterium]|nr:histone deacetylase [Polyangiaceae bacterium]